MEKYLREVLKADFSCFVLFLLFLLFFIFGFCVLFWLLFCFCLLLIVTPSPQCLGEVHSSVDPMYSNLVSGENEEYALTH